MTASSLLTDGYKFSMAEAGWPLRKETFYGSHRKGGLQVLPFDVKAELQGLLPHLADGELQYLAEHEYELGSGARAALQSRAIEVHALPKLSVFGDREPIFSVTGPSGLVSWLEPTVLMWSYRIQVATLAVFEPQALAAAVSVVTCEQQKQLVLETLDAVKVPAPSITVDERGYVARVRAQTEALVKVVGTPSRIFEVGLRAATCPQQHLLALEGVKAAGVMRTSNVWGARALGMTPVGTMGHEHVQRYGSDAAAFRAMVERRPLRSSFLLDTFDTVASGIPAAFEVMAERGGGDSVRFDSGDKEAQFRFATAEAARRGLRPVYILEDGFDLQQTQRFEALRVELGVRPEEQVYGYGGYLVAKTSGSPLTRDRVAAVFKLSQSGSKPTMKFGNEAGAGKQSVPGRPVLFRRRAGAQGGPFGIVGQEGEQPPEGYERLTDAPARSSVEAIAEPPSLAPSAATAALITTLQAWRQA